MRSMVRCAFPAHLLTIMTIAALATPGNGGKRPACSFGTEPGVWRGHNYETLNSDCRLVRYVDHITNKTSQKEVSGEVLFVGDSLNRNLIMDAAGLFGAPVSNYTPVAYDDRGLPEKIGRNEMLRLGSLVMANIFHFGAHERETHWLGPARAGIAGMHNTTYGRVCLDAPRYLKLAGIHKDPYMVIINSNYWDAMHHSFTTVGPPPKKDRSLPRAPNGSPVLPPGATNSGGPGSDWEGQVMDQRADPNVTSLLDRHVDAVRDLVDIVKRCYPGTRLFCWHTAPSVGTDSRNPHWFDKRPHVVAALNAAGRFVAKEKGLCLLDWDAMFQGRNEPEWVPDGLHPAPNVSREFMNVVINTMMSHQGRHHGMGSEEAELIRSLTYDF